MAINFFIATKPEETPAGRFASVDGSVPGASVVYDHHKTGERINLDAMPETVSLEGIEAIGTTMMDADAIVSAAVFALGGIAVVPAQYVPVLRSASFWCDHLVGDPSQEEGANHIGLGLMASMKNQGFAATKAIAAQKYGGDVRQLTNTDISPVFAELATALIDAIRAGESLPCDHAYLATVDKHEETLRAPLADGSSRVSIHGNVALLNLRGLGYMDPLAQYRLHTCPVQVMYADGKPGDPGLKYTVGVHPAAGSQPDLRPTLAALQVAEAEAWVTAGETQPEGTWGGRAAVFGSPFNYGSRLTPDEVLAIVRS